MLGLTVMYRIVNKICQQKGYHQWEYNIRPLVFQSAALLTELTWQVLVEGYLT